MKRSLLLILVAVAAFSQTASAQHNALLEIFRNLDCTNCVVPDSEYAQWLGVHPEVKPIVIYYHNKFPWPDDIFYQANTKDIDARSSTFYSIEADPTVVVSGFNAQHDVNNWKTVTTQAIASPLPITITADVIPSVAPYVDLHVHLAGSTPKAATLNIALKESGIVYHNEKSYSNPAGDSWSDIFRKMISVGPLAVSGSLDTTFHILISSKWVNQVKAAVFVQDYQASSGTRLVRGMEEFVLTGSSAVMRQASGFGLGANQPNPFSVETTIPVHLAEAAQVKVVVYDVLGNQVQTLMDQMRPAGLTNVLMTANSSVDRITPGMYFIKMYVNGSEQDRRKVLYQP